MPYKDSILIAYHHLFSWLIRSSRKPVGNLALCIACARNYVKIDWHCGKKWELFRSAIRSIRISSMAPPGNSTLYQLSLPTTYLYHYLKFNGTLICRMNRNLCVIDGGN